VTATAPGAEVVERPSNVSFQETIERLTLAIETAGMTLFATFDHAAGAGDAGLSMPPTTVLVYGHAKGGTAIMLAAPHAALDLPLRVLVREDPEGHVLVAFRMIAPTLQKAGVPEALLRRLEPAQRMLLAAISE
jgi:uncharacterized protein (DUF302 family)